MISKWMLKAVVQKSLSILPNPQKANYWFQRKVTKGVILDEEHLGYKVRHAKDHISYFQQFAHCSEESVILELGTGWYPIVPLLIYLTKNGQVTSIDIQNWLTREHILYAIKRLLDWYDSGKLEVEFGALDSDRLAHLRSLLDSGRSMSREEIKREIGLSTYIVDARRTDFPDNSFDFICSNNTFEHIYPIILRPILHEFMRVLKPGGVMSHFIDMSDHFAHFDKSITVYNFLKFSKAQWGWIDNTIQPQSRLRWRDYLDMYEDLNIPVTHQELWPSQLEELRKVKVHPEYASYSENELAILHGYLVTKKEG